MARPARIDLRTFQQELATRLASKTAAQVESSRLGLASHGSHWLLRLADAGEVITVPPLASVPMTKPWFLGVANVRGNLYGVVDFAAFLGGAVAPATPSSRLVLFGARAADVNAALRVEQVIGLRNVAELAPVGTQPDAPSWYVQRWMDGDGNAWQEIDLARLARSTEFLQVGV